MSDTVKRISLILLITTIIVFTYINSRSLMLLRTKCVFKYQYLQMFDHKLSKYA